MAPMLIPIAFKYGIPAGAYLIGHLVGWLHHKHAMKVKAQTALT